MAGKSITLKGMRANDAAQVPARLGLRVVAVFVVLQILLLAALLLLVPSAARSAAAPVKGEIAVSTAGGYARLIFTLAEEVEADVRLSNGILIIAFKQAIDVPAERIAMQAAGYVGAARADPDGTAVRVALTRKVTVNSMAAGEKLFVDLLPESWTGLPPGLPQEVVEGLAKRAREAEKLARQRLRAEKQRTLPPVRVRVGIQPTFTRYTFMLPSVIPASIERADDKLTLTFDAPLRIDLADAQAALPPMVAAIEAQTSADNATVRFDLIGKLDVRSFREDNNFVIDLQPFAQRAPTAAADKPELAAIAAAMAQPAAAPPQPSPPPQAAAQAPASPAPAKPTEAKPAEAKPAVSGPPETIPARGAENAKPVPPSDPAAPVVADVRRQGDAFRLSFPFATPTSAAMFRRADTIWLVFDSAAPIDIAKIAALAGRGIRDASLTRSKDGQVVQLKLDRPKLTSVGTEGTTWSVTVGDVMLEPTQPLSVVRLMHGGGRASVSIPFDAPGKLHRLSDTDTGDSLLVVTAPGPARGFLKPQEFVEFNALASSHGVVIQPLADDVRAEVGPDKVLVTRPGGLTLSNPGAGAVVEARTPVLADGKGPNGAALDAQTWGQDRAANFAERNTQLITAAARASGTQRLPARLDLARFYLARDMGAEARGVLEVASDEAAAAADGSVIVLRAIANVMQRRGEEALKDLENPAAANRPDAALWRALALAQQGKWAEAREGLHSLEAVTAALPAELQRFAFREAVRTAIEVRNYGTAASLMNEYETLGEAPERNAELAILKGRLMEGLGRVGEALNLYRAAAESPDGPAAAGARLREIALRQTLGDMKRAEATNALEILTAAWRGDDTESEALQLLGRNYAEEGRYRDSFHVMRTALVTYPDTDMTRRIQDEAASAFETLFLGGKGESLPAIDALSLFYDYRDLTPIGRRGDEMIRKLTDRLVSVDLLDQAAELLQHQVDNRLQGAARAQVAVRLAVIYLMARKPDRAIKALQTSRSGDLPGELRSQRLMIEARAQSDIGRADLALEVVANVQGREVERLRADILWKARRWRDAGEQIEKTYGERWREFAPLAEPERADVMRAAIGFALAEDGLGLERFRQKYAPKMLEGPDRRAFEVVTAPLNSSPKEFSEIARVVASTDTLDGFLRDIRARFQDNSVPILNAPATQAPSPATPARGASAEGRRAG